MDMPKKVKAKEKIAKIENAMFNLQTKLFSGKPLCDMSIDEFDQWLAVATEERKNFTWYVGDVLNEVK